MHKNTVTILYSCVSDKYKELNVKRCGTSLFNGLIATAIGPRFGIQDMRGTT